MDVLNIKRLLLVAACMLSLSAVAEEKIAVIDVARAIFSTDIAKQRQEEMQSGSEFASLQAKYDNIGADMKALQKEVEGKAMTLSQEKAAEYKKKMEYLRADMELVSRKLQAEIKALQNRIMQELQPKALESIKELVEEGEITLLLQRESVISATPDKDLTGKLVERLNKKP
jgi:outer membrane protein